MVDKNVRRRHVVRDWVVYRLWSERGWLLYIGKSWLPDGFAARMKDHDGKPWGWLIDDRRTTFEHFPSEQQAYNAEAEAIENEQPLFCVAGNSGRGEAALRILARRMGS